MRRFPSIHALFSAAIVALGLAACASGLAVENEPGPAYALQVNNPLPNPMIVWYDDGTGTHLLGTVSAGTEGRFVITRPANPEVTVTATDENRTFTVTHVVSLQPGELTVVTLST